MNHKTFDKTIIVGCGRLGSKLAEHFYDIGQNVIIIDKDEDAFRKLSSVYGGITVQADACQMSTFKELDINKNSLLIVVTNHDNINIMISQIARECFGVEKIISRLYDPQRECVYKEFEIDTICPTFLSVLQIDEILNI